MSGKQGFLRCASRLFLFTSFLLANSVAIEAFPPLQEGLIDTVAGNGIASFSGDHGPATSASLQFPFGGVGVDGEGNIYIPDSGNNRIRRVDAVTGIITTVAGNGNGGFGGDGGLAIFASLSFPTKVVVDNNDNFFIVDLANSRIRRVDAATGIITTVAGNENSGFNGDNIPATDASLDNPEGAALDSHDNLFIADQVNSRIRRVDAVTGIITTVAGSGVFGFSGDGGPAHDASFRFPTDVAVDTDGNLFIADLGNRRIRRVDAVTGIITTVAGNGNTNFNGDNIPATDASLAFPVGIALDGVGNIFIADGDNRRIRRVDIQTGIISTTAGSGAFCFVAGGDDCGDGGPAVDAGFFDPFGVTIDGSGNLFISDVDNNQIRRVFLGGIDGDGPIVSNIQATPNPVAVNNGITLTATVDDFSSGGSEILAAEFNIDGGLFASMTASDGTFDEIIEDVAALLPAFQAAGVRNICVRGTDGAGNVGEPECIQLAVYDPEGGFVTGGGWITSPAGAYAPNPSLAGRASFGFVSKHTTGATVPSGETEFRLKLANLRFHSTSYDWLVVAGARAQYRGSGEINGMGNYGFILTATDGQANGGGGADRFRIKIWDKNNGDAVVYDNQLGDSDTEEPSTILRGGSIVSQR